LSAPIVGSRRTHRAEIALEIEPRLLALVIDLVDGLEDVLSLLPWKLSMSTVLAPSGSVRVNSQVIKPAFAVAGIAVGIVRVGAKNAHIAIILKPTHDAIVWNVAP
jgi:hypothetical protein